MSIRAEKIHRPKIIMELNGFELIRLLKGEIPGMETNYAIIEKGNTFTAVPEIHKARVLFFLAGRGSISVNGQILQLSEMAGFVPVHGGEFSIQAAGEPIEYLDINYDLTGDEMEELMNRSNRSHYFVSYSECSTYREAVKSEKTLNRTIIPDNIIPRFCMGSVETAGPDAVGIHEHPVLEQIFFGLRGNCCTVIADGETIHFGENTALHIPLGSKHGVAAGEGGNIHYLWMDLFQKKEDMAYIQKNHLQGDTAQ